MAVLFLVFCLQTNDVRSESSVDVVEDASHLWPKEDKGGDRNDDTQERDESIF